MNPYMMHYDPIRSLPQHHVRGHLVSPFNIYDFQYPIELVGFLILPNQTGEVYGTKPRLEALSFLMNKMM